MRTHQHYARRAARALTRGTWEGLQVYGALVAASYGQPDALSAYYNDVPESRGTSRTRGTFTSATARDAEDASKLAAFRAANPVRDYRLAHPERVVWSPERGWHDQPDAEAS
jgi:hypothetical protein